MNQNKSDKTATNLPRHERSAGGGKTDYIRSLFAKEDDILQKVIASIEANDIMPINLGPEEAKIVQILLKLHASSKVVEIGTLVGYSTIWIARALNNRGRVYSFEKNEKTAEVAKANISSSDVANKIEVIVGSAHERLHEIEKHGPFDAIFIDAEKAGYCKYLDWAEKNLRQGGLIIGDNTFLWGKVYDDNAEDNSDDNMVKVMREFNQRLADSSKYAGIIIPTAEGMTIAIKKF